MQQSSSWEVINNPFILEIVGLFRKPTNNFKVRKSKQTDIRTDHEPCGDRNDCAKGWTTNTSWLNFRYRQEILFLSKMSRPGLRLTQSRIQWGSVADSRRVSRPVREATTHLHLLPRLGMTALHLYTPICFHNAKRNHLTLSQVNPAHTCTLCFSKVKKSVYETWRRIGGSKIIAPINLNFGTICWRWEVSFTHRPLYRREKKSRPHLIVGWVGPGADLNVLEKRLISFNLPEIETRIFQSVPQSSHRISYRGSSNSLRTNLISLCHLNVSLPRTPSFRFSNENFVNVSFLSMSVTCSAFFTLFQWVIIIRSDAVFILWRCSLGNYLLLPLTSSFLGLNSFLTSCAQPLSI